MFVRTPFTQSLFHPQIHTPSISYWVLPPTFDEDVDEKTVLAANKPKADAPKSSTTVDESGPSSLRFLLDDFEVVEEDGHIVLSTDLPGIKHADLRVDFHDGTLHIEGSRKKGTKKQSFSRRLAMDEDAIDIEKMTATLEDGILTVKAPKAKPANTNNKEDEKETGGRKLVVSKASPPQEPAEMNMEIDMPGVKLADLEIVLANNGLLSVVGERKRSGKSEPTKVTEAYMLNTRKVDVSKMEAYLDDGVLTIRAPARVHKKKTVAVNGKLPAPKEDKEEANDKKKGQ
jgi:HSP20 family molecular chaperone IbpA